MTDQRNKRTPAGDTIAEEQLRATVLSCLADGRTQDAAHAAHTLIEQHGGRRTHRFLREAVAAEGPSSVTLRHVKVALLSSFSIEFLHDSLVALGLIAGMRVEIYQAGFATFRQELLDAGSALYAWAPDVVIVAVEGEDWAPAAFAGYMKTAAADGLTALASGLQNELRELIRAFRAHSTAPLLVHNIAQPAWRKLGIADAKQALGQGRIVDELNAAFAIVARETDDVHVVDYAALVNRHGALNWYDERMKLYARAPIANAMQPHLSAEYVKYFAALTGMTRKCLVLDLDNTLWGGVIGEDGVEGIHLGPNYPGSAFVEFQRYVLDLHQRGVILAIASKNNPADVDEVFAKHRSMVLDKTHFANMQIHWEPKSQSLQRIAEELSIGLEHLVFVDDNPVECEQVRRALPMVRVIQLPPQPERYVGTLQDAALFDTLSVSDEDRRRGDLYRQRAQAEAARVNVTSVEDYYRELGMTISFSPVNRASLPRASQLTQKTNQLNVTTLRYSEAEIAKRMADERWHTMTVVVEDKFGDNGIVGVTMAEEKGDSLDVDTLLLSCRVIGRTVETAILAELCEEARRRRLKAVTGRIIPSSKNAPARDIFERHGFARTTEDDSGTTCWRLDLGNGNVAWPAWFKRQSQHASVAAGIQG